LLDSLLLESNQNVVWAMLDAIFSETK